MRRLRVAAGILRDPDGRVLITERVGGGPFQGMWEFPGGKVEPGETPEDAVIREIAEELVVSVGTIKTHINHIYQKLDVHSRTQALARAIELNLA